MKKENILWLLVGATIAQAFINLYLGYSSWMLFTGLSSLFVALLCVTPKTILGEELINEVKNEKRKKE